MLPAHVIFIVKWPWTSQWMGALWREKKRQLYNKWISQNPCACTSQTSHVIRNGNTATVTSAFSPRRKKKKKKKLSQNITVDHPQQELGKDKDPKFRLRSCSQKLCRIVVTKGINSYQPIPFINMWPLKFKLQSQLVSYFLLQRTTWRIVIGRFRFNLSVTFCKCPSTVVNHLIGRRKTKSLIKIWTSDKTCIQKIQ